MRKSKKIIFTVCVILCFSVAFMITSYGYSASAETFYLKSNWVEYPDEQVLLGTVMQYNSSGSGTGWNIFSTNSDVTLLRDSYGVYGYNWNGFASISSGFKDHGTFSLKTTIPWSNFFPSDEAPYEISKIYLKYRMFGGRYTDSYGNYNYFNLKNAYGVLYADGEPVQSFTMFDDIKEGQPFVIDFEGSLVVTTSTNLMCEIRWEGKPSSSSNPFLLFEWVRDGSYMTGTLLNNYMNDINNQVGSDLDEIKTGLEMEEPDVDFIIDGLDPSLKNDAYLFRGSGSFYNFISSAAVVGVTIGSIGYILHGKKD